MVKRHTMRINNIPTSTENKLRDLLEAHGYTVVQQYPLRHTSPKPDKYGTKHNRYDLAIPDHKIFIEVDGEKGHTTSEDRAKDRRRDWEAYGQGWDVVRVPNEEIWKNPSVVLKRIDEAINSPTVRPGPKLTQLLKQSHEKGRGMQGKKFEGKKKKTLFEALFK